MNEFYQWEESLSVVLYRNKSFGTPHPPKSLHPQSKLLFLITVKKFSFFIYYGKNEQNTDVFCSKAKLNTVKKVFFLHLLC